MLPKSFLSYGGLELPSRVPAPIFWVAQVDTKDMQAGPGRSRVGACTLRSWRCGVWDPGDGG